MANDYRLRFAPSPTGPLHIGGARSALFNYLLAKKNGGTFLVRMEDTDLERSSKESEENIKDSLRWLGMDWNEGIDAGGDYGPYRQTERLPLYQEAVQKLLDEGKAYYCFCSEEELAGEKEEQLARGETPRYGGKCRSLSKEQQQALLDKGVKPVVRLRVPAGETVVIDDEVRGEVSFDTDGIGDFIIVKSDGIPVYNFAVVIDDHTMGISHVIRGEEHLSNTPRQIVIYDALGYEKPYFAHISLILGRDDAGKLTKMSKRHGSTSVVAYKEQGFLPEAIVNFLALLGWAPGGEQELFTLDELKQEFSLDRVSKSPAVFDLEKLKWINGMYIRNASGERLLGYGLPFLKKAGLVGEEPTAEEMIWAMRIIDALKNHISCFAELPEIIEKYRGEIGYSPEVLESLRECREDALIVVKTMKEKLEKSANISVDSYKKMLKEISKETGIKGRNLYHSLRVAKTGEEQGPDLDKLSIILGRDLMLKRLNAFLKMFQRMV
ncbi:MAG TPA: glutamate--tRNA ligase [Clostridiales bacterium]|nr:glutamate--tRNA ligase [Clostridiales bacterium]